jgi:hypothetical protein
MRVSVTLHRGLPDLDGNQRQLEANYRDYNRRYATLGIDPKTGDGFFNIENMEFPAAAADPQTLTHFSLGVSEAPANQGGAIIIVGELARLINVTVGAAPLLQASGGVHKERLDTMLADGRLFSLD